MVAKANINSNTNTGKVNINGKTYQTVAYRLAEFRKQHPIESGWAIETECVQSDDEKVVFKATIKNPEGQVIATGHAEEKRDQSFVNKTSALENAETSAIGRALAAAGFVGSEFASANEVETAVKSQKAISETKPATKSESTTHTTEKVKASIPGIPDISKPGWEKMKVPKPLLPVAEREKSIKWIDLILDTVKLQGQKRVLSGAQYLHAIENWKNSLVQRSEVQAVIKAALQMRARLKAVMAMPV